MKNVSAMLRPRACRPEAFHYVRRHLLTLHCTHGLVHSILGVALHALDDVSPNQVDDELNRLAQQVLSQCHGAATDSANNRAALVAHLHDVLFEQEKFGGAPPERYYSPLNSYLPAVFGLKYGLPITLGLIYKAVAERVGLPVEGIFSRGHFLVRVHDGAGWLIVDPYHGGRVLTVAEACDMISQIVGEPLQADPNHLPTATNKEWLTRVIVNLAHVFQTMQRQHDYRAMEELLQLVQWHS
jgi:regulator of sirC expression with transglutaminase-like and TPR domain